MYAQSAILAALLRRERTGQGANVKVAMLDALAEWMTYPMYRLVYGNSALPRQPLNHPALAPYGAHRRKDGQVIFGLQNEREWAAFCTKVWAGRTGRRIRAIATTAPGVSIARS